MYLNKQIIIIRLRKKITTIVIVSKVCRHNRLELIMINYKLIQFLTIRSDNALVTFYHISLCIEKSGLAINVTDNVTPNYFQDQTLIQNVKLVR